MLRRDFIKTAVLTGTGLILASELVLASSESPQDNKPMKLSKRTYQLHGHARSGCATPPELFGIIENGINCLPY